jgi:hypothetical protein
MSVASAIPSGVTFTGFLTFLASSGAIHGPVTSSEALAGMARGKSNRSARQYALRFLNECLDGKTVGEITIVPLSHLKVSPDH